MTGSHGILGTTDTAPNDCCDCCGRAYLKTYIAVQRASGEIGYYGTTCAAVMLRVDAAEVRRDAEDADRSKRAAARREADAADAADTDAWLAWLSAHASTTEPADQIRELGGWAAARAAFKAR